MGERERLLPDDNTFTSSSSQSSSPRAARRNSSTFYDPDVAAAASFSADFESRSTPQSYIQRSYSSGESLHSRRSEARGINLPSPQRPHVLRSNQSRPDSISEPNSPGASLSNPTNKVASSSISSIIHPGNPEFPPATERNPFSDGPIDDTTDICFRSPSKIGEEDDKGFESKILLDDESELNSEADVCLPPSTFDYENVADYLSSMSSALSSKKNSRTIQSRKKNLRGIEDSKQRFLFYSEASGVLRAEYFECLDFSPVEKSIIDILKSGPFWLDVCGASHAEMQTLTKVFGIHPLTTEDIETEDTREKCELFPSYYFITIRTFDSNQYSLSYMHPINLYIVVFRECVLSFHSQAIPHPANVLRRIDHLKAYGLKISPDWLNYALIDDVTDGFMPVMRFIELEVDSIDDLVLILKESEQTDMLRRIGHARKKVMMLLRLLITKADVLKAVIKRCGEKLVPGSETMLYLGDIQDHVITMVQNLNHFENTLARAHSNYLAQISIEITQASNRTSIVVMRMTALASILIPLNVITGLWGMNVKVPGQDSEGLFWFAAIASIMGLMALTAYTLVRRWKLVKVLELELAIIQARKEERLLDLASRSSEASFQPPADPFRHATVSGVPLIRPLSSQVHGTIFQAQDEIRLLAPQYDWISDQYSQDFGHNSYVTAQTTDIPTTGSILLNLLNDGELPSIADTSWTPIAKDDTEAPTAVTEATISAKSKKARTVVIDISMHCSGCKAHMASGGMSGCPELLQLPFFIDSLYITCGICVRQIGACAVKFDGRGLTESSDDDIILEAICANCLSAYKFCSNCGGGAFLRIGKWRPKELFVDGRKNCSLPHIRIGQAEKFKYAIYQFDIAFTDGTSFVQKVSATSLRNDIERLPYVDLDLKEALRSISSDLSKNFKLMFMNTEGEALAMRDCPSLNAWDKLARNCIEGSIAVEKFVHGGFRIDKLATAAEKVFRRFVILGFYPNPKSSLKSSRKTSEFSIGGMCLCQWNITDRSLFFGEALCLGLQSMLKPTSMFPHMFAGALKRVDEVARLNPELETPLHVWGCFRKRQNKGDRSYKVFLKKNGLLPMEDYIAKHQISKADADSIFTDFLMEDSYCSDMQYDAVEWDGLLPWDP
ncbi:CorA metal ion transporter [Dinochytrium kinnereticum]|nr:CorA metal ion transporter [Dinochytrium kinnereticum]